MGLYVEVMCDVRKDGREPGNNLFISRCWSYRNANPRGQTVAEARHQAKKQGWLVRGKYTVCPGCRGDEP